MPFPDVGHQCPRPYRFPFAEAEAAGAAIDDLQDQHQSVASALGAVASGLSTTDFAGVTAELWRLSVQGFMEGAGWAAIGLVTERSSLDASVQAARTAEANRDAAILTCIANHPDPNGPV